MSHPAFDAIEAHQEFSSLAAELRDFHLVEICGPGFAFSGLVGHDEGRAMSGSANHDNRPEDDHCLMSEGGHTLKNCQICGLTMLGSCSDGLLLEKHFAVAGNANGATRIGSPLALPGARRTPSWLRLVDLLPRIWRKVRSKQAVAKCLACTDSSMPKHRWSMEHTAP